MKKILLLPILSIILTSCATPIGCRKLMNDSICYNRAVQQSTEEQLLLNIVRLRYRDTPAFLNVGVVSQGYDFKRSLAADLRWQLFGHENAQLTPKIGVDFTDKPTTTYQPLRGDSFAKEFLSPINMNTMALLHSSGWRIDRLFRCCVQRINNVKNAPTASGPTPVNAPQYHEFLELASLLHELELEDNVRIVAEKVGGEVTFILDFDETNSNLQTLARIRNLLELDSGVTRVKMVPYNGKTHAGDEVMVDARSPLSLLYYLSQGVHVPPGHEQGGLVTVTNGGFDWDQVMDGVINIRYNCSKKQTICGTKICYRGVTYYIDDRDLSSKSTFSLLAQLLALHTGSVSAPVLTLPIASL